MFKPEEKFVISCIDTIITGKNMPCGDYTGSEFDWSYVSDIAAHHRVIPAVYSCIRKFGPSAIPTETISHFRDASFAIGLNSFYLSKELLAVLSLLRENHIDATPLKGPVISYMAYGSVGLREFTDIDILIREVDLSRAKIAITKGDYEIIEKEKSGQVQFDNECELCLLKDTKLLKLDIHWKIRESQYGVDDSLDYLFSRCAYSSFLNTKILILSDEDMLMTSLMHHGKECWKELRYVADIAGLILRRKGMDWNYISERSQMAGTDRNLYLGLYLAKSLFTIEIPDSFCKRIKCDPMIERLGLEILKKYFTHLEAYAPGDVKFNFRLQKQLNPKLKRLYYLRETAKSLARPNDIDKRIIKLPRSLFFIYYLIRFFRVARNYGIKKVAGTLLQVIKSI